MREVHKERDGLTAIRLVEFHPQHFEAQLDHLRQMWPKGPLAPAVAGGSTSKLAFTRWSCEGDAQPFEICSEVDVLEHVVTVPLRRSNLLYDVGARPFVDGDVIPGSMYLMGPTTQRSRVIYREAFDTFRIYLANELISEAVEGLNGRHSASNACLFLHRMDDDRLLHHLAMSALAVSSDGWGGSPICLDSIGLALAIHLVRRHFGAASGRASKGATPLASWRLRRVTDYVEATLTDDDLSLGTLSAIAGLSRMHFASQFRAATGVSPHTYVVQRKIERAREMLMDSPVSIKHVALGLGFKSDAQFVRVFRKAVGLPPGRWRRTIRSC